jgi:hypothetical protein
MFMLCLSSCWVYYGFKYEDKYFLYPNIVGILTSIIYFYVWNKLKKKYGYVVPHKKIKEEEKKEKEETKKTIKEESKTLGEENNLNLSSLLIDKDKDKKEEEKNEEIIPQRNNHDVNLQFYFPLQNKLLNNTKMLNVKDDKTLQDSFHSKNFEYYREREHLKMAVRHKFVAKNMIEGSIPGNFGGQSSGRMGGMHLLPNNKILIIYSRVECDNECGEKNDISELCFLSFNNQFKIEKSISFRPGSYINFIKHAKYGDNIFVMISETTLVSDDKKYIYDKYTFFGEDIEEEHYPCNCFLMNQNGEIISDLMMLNYNFFSPNDDFETLKDGSVVWTFVDDDDCLYLCFLACKSTFNYLNKFPDSIMPMGKYNDYLIKVKEEEEEEKKRKDKEFLISIGIDEDLIKKKLLESELLEKERLAKELEEKRLAEEEKRLEEEKKKKEEEEKENMLKEIEEEARQREKMRRKKEQEEREREERERRKKEKEEKKKKKKRGKNWDSSESEEEEEEEEKEQDDDKLSNYYM